MNFHTGRLLPDLFKQNDQQEKTKIAKKNSDTAVFMIQKMLIVGTGGFIGSALRYIIQVYSARLLSSTYPLGTFIVNITGCLLIGIIYAISEKGNLMGPEWRIFLTVGFCGGFTTFSTFAYDNLMLLRDNSVFQLLLNAGGSLFLGIFAVYVGILITRIII